MKTVRRRKSDLDERRPFWRTLPHTYLYPALGFAIGLCTPLGAFLMRFWLASPLLKTLWIRYERALTGPSPLSLLLLDIDDFKKVNDLHGHLFGDRVIKETAETIAACVRGDDIFGRLGGDEFLVIMPGADHDTAGVVAKRICTSFAKSNHMATVSIGAASLTGTEKVSAADVLHRADVNLYQAKREGKNRVCAGGKVAATATPVQPA